MAVSREPILKRCRYLGISPAVLGYSKESKRFTKVQQGGRKKFSEYALQLKEKQKLKFIYGVLERPFFHYFELASKMEGKAGDNLVTILESRLDNVCYRAGFALTRREAREMVTHGLLIVDGRRVDIPSIRVKEGSKIELRERNRTSDKYKDNIEQTRSRITPLWLDVNRDAFSINVTRMPQIEDIDYEVEAHLIVELYSK